MKKIFISLLLLSILFLVACNKGKQEAFNQEEEKEDKTYIDRKLEGLEEDLEKDKLQNDKKIEEEEVVVAKRAFPQHTTYVDGVIKPNHVSQEELDKATTDLYDAWKAKYMKEKPDSEGRYYVWYSDGDWFKTGSEEDKIATTVSEAHGYGMIILATMAGYDIEAKKLFDGMFYYFQEHKSGINPNLMAWQQGYRDGKTINIGGADGATDGDMDIAYSLLLAHSQWGSEGKIDYLAEANKIIDALMDSCIDQDDFTIRVGDWATSGKYRSLTRSSDFMMGHLRVFKQVLADDKWDRVIDKTYEIINDVYENESKGTGILPDFLVMEDGKAQVPQSSVLEGEYDGALNYNACRTYWRLATDYIMDGEDRALEPMRAYNQWIINSTNNDPRQIKAGYLLSGQPIPNRNYTDLSFTGPFIVPAMIDEANQEWVNALWDNIIGEKTESNYYFGNTLRLLNVIVASGNWLEP